METSFLVQVVQLLVIAIGFALAGANAFALWHSRRAMQRYDADLDAWRKAGKKKKVKGEKAEVRGPKPEEPQQVRTNAAAVNVGIGTLMGLLGLASLTFNWVK